MLFKAFVHEFCLAVRRNRRGHNLTQIDQQIQIAAQRLNIIVERGRYVAENAPDLKEFVEEEIRHCQDGMSMVHRHRSFVEAVEVRSRGTLILTDNVTLTFISN